MLSRRGLLGLMGLCCAAATLLVAPAASAAPTTVAYWHMDETSGTTMVDASAFHNDGTLTNVKTGVAGFVNRAYSFGTIGLPSFASVPNDDSLNPHGSSIRLSMWAKFPTEPSAAVHDFDMVRKGLGSTPGGDYKMEILRRAKGTSSPEGKALCFFQDSSGREAQLIRGPDLSDNQWHRIECLKTASFIRLFVDGVAFTRNAALGTIANSEGVFVGAKSQAGADQYTGAMDEVSIVIG